MRHAIWVAATALSFASAAHAEYEQCLMPEQGIWTVGGQGQFTIKVEGCGEVIIAEGLGDPQTGAVKTIPRLADGSYDYLATNQGIPFALEIDLLDPRNMTFSWTVGPMRRPVYAAQFTGEAPVGMIPAVCGCEKFVGQLRDEVASNDYFIWLYSNPALYARPPELAPSETWTSDLMEDVVNTGPQNQRELLANRSRIAEGGRRGLAERTDAGGGGAGGGGPVIMMAATSCDTCVIDPPDYGNACAADVLEQAALAHEGVHAKACTAQNATYQAWNPMSGTDRPKSYCVATNVADVLAAEEVRAYRTGNAYIRDWYRATCKAEL